MTKSEVSVEATWPKKLPLNSKKHKALLYDDGEVIIEQYDEYGDFVGCMGLMEQEIGEIYYAIFNYRNQSGQP